MNELIIEDCIGFEWDQGNQHKNYSKHSVAWGECEQVFFNHLLLIYNDLKHSQYEKRSYALGRTDAGRKLFIVFAVRNQLIRVISARDMSKKERGVYEKTQENT